MDQNSCTKFTSKLPNVCQVINFPYNFTTRKYKTHHYLPEMTDNNLSLQEVSDFCSEIESHLQEWHQVSCRNIILVVNAILVTIIFAIIKYLPNDIVNFLPDSYIP